MDIASLPRIVWIVLGALLGALIGYQWASVSDTMDGIARASQIRFEQDLMMKDKNGDPLIKGIVVHPPLYSPADHANVNIVTYKRLAQDRQGKYWWIDKCFVAKIPFEPMNGGIAATPNMTVQTYLAAMAKQNSGVEYNYGWWMQPKNATMLGAGFGLVLIGGLWPSLLNIMIGAGFGPKRETKKISLWSTKNRKAAEKSKPVVTAEQVQQVADITAAYEQNLGAAGMAIDTPPPAAGANKPTEPQVRQLQTAALEEAKPQAPANPDDIEVKGEYYPVLIHHKKKDEAGPRG
jgi:hypothetical protein